ncbi:MAG TPA: retropepsin-like aspartic protease [Herpetosiphonaceae bacterium]|nr:retropepsin-like aspartic protease [Herpetosiphonaceae bacterium]
MPRYDGERFQPPAPLAHVVLRSPETGETLPDIPMLLDTGADVTLVPQTAVEGLGVLTAGSDQFQVMGFDGTISAASAVRLELTFARRTFRGDFLVVDQPWGILGRNVLNAVPLILDGPRLQWDEQPAGA